MVSINGPLAEVDFGRFDLEMYGLFLKTKKLPESQITYDWERDAYKLTTPARFAGMLGASVAAAVREALEISGFLFDYQRFIVRTALEARRYAIYADCGLGKTLRAAHQLGQDRRREAGPSGARRRNPNRLPGHVPVGGHRFRRHQRQEQPRFQTQSQ